MTCTHADAYRLMHDGAIALSRVEAAGMRIDVRYLDEQIKVVAEQIVEKSAAIKKSEVWRVWRKQYGEKANLGSRDQLGNVLFNLLGFPCTKRTRTGRPSVDEGDLQAIDNDFTRDYLAVEKLRKLHSTYLCGIRGQVEGEFLHPFFSLHTARTYRSSSQDPNFQNIPIRNREISKVIRKAFIPRENHVLVEVDYAAIEVRIAACYHRDPTMLTYIEQGYDMHHDMAKECFRLTDAQVSKTARHAAKNGFVFPEFYGDYFPSVAAGLWGMIKRNRIETGEGVPLDQHLADKQIVELGAADRKGQTQEGTFTHHIKRVEQRFWEKRFPVYKRWRDTWWEAYKETGEFLTLTGFVIRGRMRRNEVINYPVQGSAFHCLLWSMIRVVRFFERHRLRSLVVGQIHDSMLLDVHQDELSDILPVIRRIMCVDIRKAWPWIITPLDVEAEGSAVNWHEKKGISCE